MSCFIGIDVGTTNIKTAAFDQNGVRLAYAEHSVAVFHSKQAFSEYDAELLWDGVCTCLRELEFWGCTPNAVGVSSFGECMFPLDSSGMPLGRGVAWFDMRASQEAAQMEDDLGSEWLFRTTGQRSSAKFSASKLLWTRKHMTSLFNKTSRFLSAMDYIAFRLTGHYATDFSMASRSMLFDTGRKMWSPRMLEYCGLREEQLSKVYAAGEIVGSITRQAEDITGIPAGTPVTLGGHDHSCAMVAAGADGVEILLDSLGTSETAVFAGRQPLDVSKLYEGAISFYPYRRESENNYRYISSLQACGASIEWAATAFAGGDFDAFFRQAEVGENAPLYMPFIRGLQESSNVKGAFLGLQDSHSREDLCRGVLEGICFEQKRRIESMEKHIGKLNESIHLRAVGKLSTNSVLMQLKADIMEKPLEPLAYEQAVCLGAAHLAAGTVNHTLQVPMLIEHSYLPNISQREKYREQYNEYMKAFKILNQYSRQEG